MKLRRQHGLDIGQPIEPLDRPFAWLAILQALVQFLADGEGQPGDFAGAAAGGGKAGWRWLGFIGRLDSLITIYNWT